MSQHVECLIHIGRIGNGQLCIYDSEQDHTTNTAKARLALTDALDRSLARPNTFAIAVYNIIFVIRTDGGRNRGRPKKITLTAKTSRGTVPNVFDWPHRTASTQQAAAATDTDSPPPPPSPPPVHVNPMPHVWHVDKRCEWFFSTLPLSIGMLLSIQSDTRALWPPAWVELGAICSIFVSRVGVAVIASTYIVQGHPQAST